MNFKISSATLFGSLSTLSRVIASKNALSILDNFLFKLEGEQLTVTASDLDTTLIANISVDSAEGSGMVALSAKILLDTLKEFPDMPLLFNVNDENLETTITSDIGGIYTFIGVNGNEYPKIPTLAEENKTVSISAEKLMIGISRTIFATDSSDLRRVMMGILFDFVENGLTFVASDTHKLIRVIDKSIKMNEPCSFILPHKPANLLKGSLAKEEGNVEVSFDSKNAFFKMPNYMMVCRLIEGKYPNYNSVIPKENLYKVIMDRTSFYNTMRRVSVFANKSSHLINIELTENMLTVSAQDIDFSISAVESLPCQYNGEPMVIGFKADFVLEILSNLEGEEIAIEITSPQRPGIFVPTVQAEDEDVLMLLMPMGNGNY